MKVLVIAVHPDDEVLGCGGAVAKHNRNKDEVYLCVITQAYTPDWTAEFIKNRPKEIEKARKILGIKKVYSLGFPTAKLDTIGIKELNDSILRIILKLKPHTVYIPFIGDISKDHRLVSEAAMVAARPKDRNPVKRLLAYETLSETEWGSEIAKFAPNIYIDITGHINVKINAMNAYKSEIKKAPHPRSEDIIRAHALKRGSEAGVKFAEAFMLIREII